MTYLAQDRGSTGVHDPPAGLKIEGMRVGQVRALIEQRGYSVAYYLERTAEDNVRRESVPDNWFVLGSQLVVDKQVVVRAQPKLR
ncbi:hypothetical protein E1263_14205 [Kribbella antibiotica]|uniref:PASTA domain-containing protein n=1 Tax=Kribbella antibiotica TaxID=190195 RepID=A0A4R4ZND0_9ACTN|nr:hypothetical protein [Kribbella antibiotica]TDD59636.1 hypothetical protein E1263_14205 [Kribbella antibiotica]